MDILNHSMLQIHFEMMHRDAGFYFIPQRSAVAKPTLLERGLSTLGEAMIHLGHRMKDHSNHSYMVEKAAEPTFMIML